jgi:aryl-phospho-beta-D-glucosidase BglC (GH1 family)
MSGGAADELGLCENLGSQCGLVLETRYATWTTTSDLDNAASASVTLLRIPTTYAAWINYPRSKLYSGNQKPYLKTVTTYAVEKYGMHIVLDVHRLPGGINSLTIREADSYWN